MDYLYEYISEKLLKFAVVPHAGTWIEILKERRSTGRIAVVPHAGTWIEILAKYRKKCYDWSFPTRERGLKFDVSINGENGIESFPTRERGLKSPITAMITGIHSVVPHAGTWIEIVYCQLCWRTCKVVPHAGTWIEICSQIVDYIRTPSFPTRERGLKSFWSINVELLFLSFPTRERGLKWVVNLIQTADFLVVPHAGTWIEMPKACICLIASMSFPTRERGLK